MNTLIYVFLGAIYLTVVSSARHRLQSYGGSYAGHIEYDDFVPGKKVQGPSVVGPHKSATHLAAPHIGVTYILGPEYGPPRIVTPVIIPGHIIGTDGSHDPIIGPTVGVISIVGPPNPWSKFAEPGYEWKNGWMDW